MRPIKPINVVTQVGCDKEMAVLRDEINQTLRLHVHGHTRNGILRRVQRLEALAALRTTLPSHRIVRRITTPDV